MKTKTTATTNKQATSGGTALTVEDRRRALRERAILRDQQARKRIEANRRHLASKRLGFTIM